MTTLAGSTQRKKRLKLLQDSIARCRIDLSLHKITTAEECLSFLGAGARGGVSGKISVTEFNKQIAFPLEEELRQKLAKEAEHERNGSISSLHTDSVDVSSNRIISPLEEVNYKVPLNNYPSITQLTTRILTYPKRLDEFGKYDKHPLDDTDWRLISEHPCILLPHQTKASKDLIWKLFVENRRAVLLQAGVGVGKTFIYGKVLKELWTRNWFSGRTFSPWPVLIITKARVITQTERVMKKMFGLEDKQFKVINYDLLRSMEGLQTFIKMEVKHQQGIPYKHFSWVPGINPLVVVIDECQSAKNEQSQQSKIVRALNELVGDIRIIFSSATAFTRVSESQYMCINLGIEYELS